MKIGYKKCYCFATERFVLVELEILDKYFTPPRAKTIYDKSRAKRVRVIKIHGGKKEACSIHDPSFIYREGSIVEPRENFDENPDLICSSGIHFYFDKQGAIRHDCDSAFILLGWGNVELEDKLNFYCCVGYLEGKYKDSIKIVPYADAFVDEEEKKENV